MRPPLLFSILGPRLTLRSIETQRDALEAAHTVRASADAAYLECDPTDRPPLAEFVGHYAAAAVADLDAALGQAGLCFDGGGASAAAVQAAAAKLGGGEQASDTHHLLLADVLLARDSLRAVAGKTRGR